MEPHETKKKKNSVEGGGSQSNFIAHAKRRWKKGPGNAAVQHNLRQQRGLPSSVRHVNDHGHIGDDSSAGVGDGVGNHLHSLRQYNAVWVVHLPPVVLQVGVVVGRAPGHLEGNVRR